MNNHNFTQYDTTSQLHLTKILIHESNTFTRDHIRKYEAKSIHSKLTNLSSIARAIWTANGKLAKKMMDDTSEGKLFLDMTSGTPALLHPQLFETETLATKNHILDTHKLELQKHVVR